MKLENSTRWILIGGAVLVLAAAMVSGCGKKPEPPAESVDLSKPGDLFTQPIKTPAAEPAPTTVVAVVDGAEITWGDITQEVDRAIKAAQRRLPPERLAQMRTQLLAQAGEGLIVKNLLVNEVERQGIVVTDEEIAEARGRFTSALSTNVTLEQILAEQGVTPEEFNDELIIELRINKLIEQQMGEIPDPTEEELAAFYEEQREQMKRPESVLARHILIGVPADAPAEAKEAKKTEAENIRVQLLGGADFAQMAQERSDCPSKVRGGELPRFARGDMVKPFEEAAFSQPVGEIGPIVETTFGYHIIQVQDHADARELTLDEVRNDLIRVLKTQKRQMAVRELIERLRAKANIQRLNPPVPPPAM